MKKQSLSISVPEPCHEKWSEMTPADKGRHCQSCQKTVVDFTSLPKLKIAEYIAKNQGSMCGRFTPDQLNVELIPPKPSKTWFKYAAILLGLIPAIGYSQEVSNQNNSDNTPEITNLLVEGIIETELPLKGEIAVEKPSKQIQSKILIGRVVDKGSGHPILFGSVAVYNKNGLLITGVQTGLEGEFSIDVPEEGSIKATYTGYEPQKLNYKELKFDGDFVIQLKEGAILGDVIVVGMYAPRKMVKIPLVNKVEGEKIGEIKTAEVKSNVNNERPKIDTSVATLCDQSPFVEITDLIYATRSKTKYTTVTTTGIMIASPLKENWLERLWKKFKNLVKNSHSESPEQIENENKLIAQLQKAPPSEKIALKSNRPQRQENFTKEIVTNSTIAPDEILNIVLPVVELVGLKIKKNVCVLREFSPGNQEDINVTSNEDVICSTEGTTLTEAPEHQSIKEEKTKLKVDIYPNPTQGQINIELSEAIVNFKLNISNINNELVYSKNYQSKPSSIDLSNLVSGSYILSIIHQDELIYSEMFIKI